MSYVDSVLQPQETILARTRLHWIIYLPSFTLLAMAALISLFGSGFDTQSKFLCVIASFVLGVIGIAQLLTAWTKRITTELAVTNRRIIHKTGLFGRNTREMNREKVESVDVRQSPLGRILGYGTISVRGIGSTWEPFVTIEDPIHFRSTITAATDSNQP